MGDPYESSEQKSTFGEEASNEEDSRDISSAPSLETETVEDSLDERTTVVGEGQYEHTPQPTPSLPPVCSSSFSFFCIFHLSLPYIFHFFTPRSTFQVEVEIDMPLDLYFLNQTTPTLHPPPPPPPPPPPSS